MRGTSLSTLLSMLNAELGNSTAAGNTARDNELKALLSNKQKLLATRYHWPFLERRWITMVLGGSQYNSIPTVDDIGDTSDINFDLMPQVEVMWTTKWQPILYGIGAQEYNALNFQDFGQASDPIQRWRIAGNVANDAAGYVNKFEVWPVPVNQQKIRFIGQRTIGRLTDNNDKADLDDMLIVLAVACDKLARGKQSDFQSKYKQYQDHLTLLRQSYPTRDEKRSMAGEGQYFKDRKIVGMTIAVR